MNFIVNNDLNKPILDFHNIGHIIGNFITGILFGFILSYLIWLLWEIGDGFKPWYFNASNKIKNSKFPTIDWFKKELFYSNKFSLQDILYWNLLGSILGSIIRIIIFSNNNFLFF
jgi:hypothetical protein